jgi:TaqI-like C-terminal specificity domain/N-6 DNA Methylase
MAKTREQGKDDVARLCAYFSTNSAVFRAPGMKEAHVRQSLIDPLFSALGWDVSNAAMAAPQYREVVTEDSLEIEGHQKAPDYTFRVGREPKFYAEAKKCTVNIGTDSDAAFQIRRYGWNRNLALSVLTDFEEFAVYDCTTRPQPRNRASHSRTIHLSYSEYPGRWEELWMLFSRDAVWSGAFDQYASSKKKRGTSRVDAEFLKELEKWREALARNIALRNKALGADQLNAAVQRTIDRLVFLRMAEDRGLEPYEQLLKLTEADDIYDRFMRITCRMADEKYDSGLFHFNDEPGVSEPPDRLTPSLSIDDNVLRPILRSVYFEHGSPYNFRELPVEILGTVYEQFLGKVIRLTEAHQAKIEEKPEVRKAGGVYYTPSFIVDWIVTNTVARAIATRTPLQLAGSAKKRAFRVIDMACGSGSFLLGAYQCLLDHCLRWYTEHDPDGWSKTVYRDQKGEWRLALAERKRILIAHVFGVDIDPQAVEVSKLSLLLKALEGESAESLSRQTRLFHDRVLPNLADNIRCGNSLVGPSFLGDRLIADPTRVQRLNPFDWQSNFAASSKDGRFDCIIGNPPWGAALDDDVRSFLRQRAPQAADYESSQYFLCEALQRLAPSGSLGMIVPNTLALNVNAGAMRQLLGKTTGPRCLLDLSDVEVFGEATVRSLIVVGDVGYSGACSVGRAAAAAIGSDALTRQVTPAELHSSETWKPFLSADTPASRLVSRVASSSGVLADYCDVRQGYIPYRTSTLVRRLGAARAAELVSTRAWHSTRQVDKSYKRELQGADVLRYRVAWSGVWVRYGEWVSTYLPLEVFSGPRVLIREITGRPPRALYAAYTDKTFVHNPSVLVVRPRDGGPSPKWIAAILNSRLMSVLFSHLAPKASKGLFPKIIITDARRLPFPAQACRDERTKGLHDRVVAHVDRMILLQEELATASNDQQSQLLSNRLREVDAAIDELVYESYGLGAEDRAIIDEWAS